MVLLSIAFFFIAWIYASVGFGGGSAYLSLLILKGIPYEEIPQLSLLCNIIVAGTSFFHFQHRGHFSWSLFWPFAVSSIPFAYLGGGLHLPKTFFLLILGLSLCAAGLRLLLNVQTQKQLRQARFLSCFAIGSIVGFVSGLVGMGGGIFLAPIMLNLGWGSAKQVAAIASAFILVNSIAGLYGQWTKMNSLSIDSYWPLLLAVFVGGQCGSRLGSGVMFSQNSIRRVTACLSLFVSLRIMVSLLLEIF
jgi:uncharacterized membrane protein YfcA